LVLVILLLAKGARADVTVLADEGCPAAAAIAANLERLGALALVAQLGTAEVRVEGPSLHVSFRDPRGEPIGSRIVAATADCAERAALAAAVLAAFAGEWVATEIAQPPAAVPPAARKPDAAVAPTATPARPWQAELGATAFGLHDGDAGALGWGARADLGRGVWHVTALVEGSAERELALGAGQGGYRFLRTGLGLGVHRRWSRVTWDATLLPMVARMSLRGKSLTVSESATSWGFALAAQTRLGLAVWRLRPFLFVGASYDAPAQRMVLRDGSARASLSPVNVQGGLGIAFGILP
jgi:hypothetical protein